MNNLTDEQFWIWLAGFVDGEGCIYICRSKNNRISWGFQHALRLEITQADSYLLEEIINRVGFGKNARNKGVDKQKWRISKRPVFAIKWSSNQAYEVIKKIYPYLVVKKKQAKLATEFQELVRGNYGKRLNIENGYSDKQAFFRQALQLAKLELFKAP